MRNYLVRAFTWAGRALIPFVAGLGVGSLLIGPAVLALTIPPQFAPRQFPTQKVHYERHVVNIATGSATIDGQIPCVTTVNGTTTADCNAKIGAVPYNAYIIRASYQVTVGCNTGGTGPTCQLALGTASGGAQIVAAGAGSSLASVVAGTALTLAAAGIGNTGNGIASTGANGGFDLWLNVHQAATGIVQASTGTFVVVIEYIAPNDGGCIYVPMAQTSPAC